MVNIIMWLIVGWIISWVVKTVMAKNAQEGGLQPVVVRTVPALRKGARHPNLD